MLYFNCDYNEGAHPRLLERLAAANWEQTPGYGEDAYCAHARELIRSACQAPEAGAHFLVGGTQANATVIRHALRPHQGAVCAETGHIHVHETGAVEASGHKCLALPCGPEGKITAGQVRALWAAHVSPENPREHTVQPGLVYVSHPTETGALYTLAELEDLRAACDEAGLFLFLDGARLGYALGAPENDVSLPDLARLCHAFTIGGTKCGALFGEAVVLPDPRLDRDFRYAIKQNGGMLAKGRLLGLQFEALLEDGLYVDICAQADRLAGEIAAAFQAAGFPEFVPSPTNQRFFLLPGQALAALSERFVFQPWPTPDPARAAIRVCASWATAPQAARELIEAVQAVGISQA